MELFIDGGCSGNGQRDLSRRQMVAVVTDDEGHTLICKTDRGGSNNIAELWALVLAVEYAQLHGERELKVWTDSQNTIKWARCGKVGQDINDRARVVALQTRLAHLLMRVNLSLEWIPRDVNLAGHVIEQQYAL